MRFADLGVSPAIVDALAAAGIDDAFEVQTLTIPPALAGLDVAGEAPTGSGKTLAFGIPMLQRTPPGGPGRPSALVLAPTRELAKQIADVLEPLGRQCDVRVLACHGGSPFEPQIEALAAGVHVVVATPGRLLDLIEQGYLTLAAVSMVVVDEADRLADMGFLPDVRRLLDMTAPERQTMLFSATLDGDIDVLIRDYQTDPVRHEVTPPAVGPVRHHLWIAHDTAKPDLLAKIVKRAGPTMVFCRTRHGADRVAMRLTKAQIRVASLHGGNSQNKREQALEDFRDGRVFALVATDVAARGLHIDGVACVVQYDLPVDPKDYVHRSGRTGRAGASGTVVTFVAPADQLHARSIVEQAGVDAELGAPDLLQIEHADVRAAIDTELAALAEIRRPGHVGGVSYRVR